MSYYGYLATRFPPRRLLGTAARRAIRVARAKLVRTAALTREELLRGLGCASPDDLARRLADRAPLLAAASARDRIPDTLDRLFPGERERAAVRAQAAAAGRLTVFGREVELARPGGGTDWQIDAHHGGRFAGWAPADDLPDAPGLDPKMAWAVGRGDQWVALGCGACARPAEGDRFAEAFTESVRDFAAHNPVGFGIQWASPMEAGLRIVCLAHAHSLLSGRPALRDPGFALDVARLVVSTGRFVLGHLEDGFAVPNNHLAADWVGLLACALFLPGWPDSARWRDLALAGIDREIERQTHPDGSSFEGSVPYHRLALEIFTAAALLCRARRIALSSRTWLRLAAMYRVARGLLSSDGALPQLGDNDSGRVFAFRERPSLDGSYLLPLGAALLGEPAVRVWPGARGAEEALWLCGPHAVEHVARLRAGPPPGAVSHPDGGFHVLRRGPFEAAVSCGPTGQEGVGGHSHNDKLAFELRIRGTLAVSDLGTFCYTSDPDVRDAFRSTRAHATVVVDGAEQSPIPKGRVFALPDAASAEVLIVDDEGAWQRFVGEHRGYVRLGVVHRREILVGDAAVVVADHLLGDGAHALELRWPLPSREARLRPLGPDERERLDALAVEAFDARHFGAGSAVEIGPAGDPLALLAVSHAAPLAASLVPSSYSPGYGEIAPALTAVFAGRAECPITLTTIVVSLRTGGGRP